MSTTTRAIAQDGHNGRRTRFWTLVTLCLLVSALTIPLAPGTAHAANLFWQCPFPQPFIPLIFPVGTGYQELRYSLVSSAPTFDVADSRVVANATDSPVSATFTSQRSTTFTLQVSVGTAAKLGEFLTANVSTTIVLSRTTALGVSATGQVPPRGRLIGEYGIEAFNVTYDATKYQVRVVMPGVPSCQAIGVQRYTTNAPTAIEGWRLRTG